MVFEVMNTSIVARPHHVHVGGVRSVGLVRALSCMSEVCNTSCSEFFFCNINFKLRKTCPNLTKGLIESGNSVRAQLQVNRVWSWALIESTNAIACDATVVSRVAKRPVEQRFRIFSAEPNTRLAAVGCARSGPWGSAVLQSTGVMTSHWCRK